MTTAPLLLPDGIPKILNEFITDTTTVGGYVLEVYE